MEIKTWRFNSCFYCYFYPDIYLIMKFWFYQIILLFLLIFDVLSKLFYINVN